MGLAVLPYSLVNGTTGDAAQVMADFIALRDAINSIDAANIVDGSVTLAELATAVKNNFLKLASAADKKVSFGTYLASFAGTGLFQDNPSIAHGLGVVPDRVLITQRTATSDSVAGVAWAKTKDATNFVPRSVAVAAAISPNFDVTFDWLAIG